MRAALLAITVITASQAAEPGMVFIPGGEYSRGRSWDSPDFNVKWYPTPHKDDLPVRVIHIDPFYMDEHEVTNAEYTAFANATRHRKPYHWIKGVAPAGKENFPVVNVSWDDAQAYCSSKRKRLPTEAEWERAARGTAERTMYPWGDRAPSSADARFNAEGPAAVCSKTRNYFGLCDMIGNVWEWTADWYDRGYYADSPERNPRGPETGIYKSLRGGSWFDQAGLFLTVAYRSWARTSERSPTIGFRCAADFPARRISSLTQPVPAAHR
jgi:sulfatase modifying factor 1